MTDSISKLFSKHLPSVHSDIAQDMASGLYAYHRAFKQYRVSTMNYEVLPEYQAPSYIMQVSSDQLWPYTPHFRAFMTLAISELFKTNITSLGFSAVTIEQTLVFVDDMKNRWVMRIKESTLNKDLNQIYMYFPRSNTSIVVKGFKQSVEQLVDTDHLTQNNLGIITENIMEEWKMPEIVH